MTDTNAPVTRAELADILRRLEKNAWAIANELADELDPPVPAATVTYDLTADQVDRWVAWTGGDQTYAGVNAAADDWYSKRDWVSPDPCELFRRYLTAGYISDSVDGMRATVFAIKAGPRIPLPLVPDYYAVVAGLDSVDLDAVAAANAGDTSIWGDLAAGRVP